MAYKSSFKALAVFLVVAVYSAAVSAQDLGMAPAQKPGMDTGSAFLLPVSGAILFSSVALSFLAFLKN